ncbi:hypothetical protein H7X65_01385 [Candidatus Parcubacteria bacterium]|nr:hypothetical protein [Candidatus Parcubacteria bacterium]
MKFLKILLTLIILFFLFVGVRAISSKYATTETVPTNVEGITFEPAQEVVPEVKKMSHVKTPENVRGIYVSANSFLYKPFLEKLDSLLDTTTINTIVVDIKDAPGTIDYDIGMDTPCVKGLISNEDLRAKLDYYHQKNIYVIARIAVLRDECFVKQYPELAAVKADGTPWRDGKGHYWLSPHEVTTAKYIADISKAVYESGFDEIQLDYVRYPSDGQMNLLKYEYSENINASSTNEMKRRATLKNFVGIIRGELGDIPLSADVFGMVLTNTDDLTIGQHLDDFAENVDYISGMIYPSHFPNGWNGIKDANRSPYQIIYDSTQQGLVRLNAKYGTSTANRLMRPWLQDFSIYGVVYNAPEVKAQIKALDDLGVKSYLLWNASNRYTPGVMERI